MIKFGAKIAKIFGKMNDETQKTALLFVFLQKYLYICKLEKL
jgi:hypothetical protein